MKIVLLGYMASGKSVIARELGEKLSLNVIDLDAYIEAKEKRTINQIFADSGEIKFRLLENKYVSEILTTDEDLILAVGGGTPCYANNMDIITQNSKSIYLKASIETIYNRLVKEKAHRPLVKDIKDSDLKEFIAKHLYERSTFYNQAQFTITTDEKNVEEISAEIIELI